MYIPVQCYGLHTIPLMCYTPCCNLSSSILFGILCIYICVLYTTMCCMLKFYVFLCTLSEMTNKTCAIRYSYYGVTMVALFRKYSDIWQSLSLHDWRWKSAAMLRWVGATFSKSGLVPQSTANAIQRAQTPRRLRSGVTLDLRSYFHLGRACRFTYAVRWSGIPRKSRHGLTYFHFPVLIWQGNAIRSSRWIE